MGNSNEQFVRNTYDEFIKGGIGSVIHLLSDDIVWHVGGKNLLTRDYKGKYEVNEFFARLMELSDGSFELEYHDVMASDQHASVICSERARRNGKLQEMETVHVWRIEGGKLAEWRRHPQDTYSDDAFWS